MKRTLATLLLLAMVASAGRRKPANPAPQLPSACVGNFCVTGLRFTSTGRGGQMITGTFENQSDRAISSVSLRFALRNDSDVIIGAVNAYAPSDIPPKTAWEFAERVYRDDAIVTIDVVIYGSFGNSEPIKETRQLTEPLFYDYSFWKSSYVKKWTASHAGKP